MQLFGNGHKFVTDADHIPGRNYLLNTSQPISVEGENRVGQKAATFYPAKDLKNQLVTFKIEVLADKDGGTMYVGNNPSWIVYKFQGIKKGLNIVEFTGTLASDFGTFVISIDNSSANLTLTNATLNLGTAAEEWQPAIEDYAMKSDLDNKVNTDRSLYFLKEGTSPLTESEIFNTDDSQGRLQAIHQRIPENGTETFGRYDNLLLFGGDNITSIFDVNTFNNQVKVATGDAQGKAIWSEFIAWKSDIQRLEQEIADLKKQIGGK